MAPRTKLVAALAVGIAAAALASACGLDDTVITGPGGAGATGGDATIGDGAFTDGGGSADGSSGSDGSFLPDADLDDAEVAPDAGALPDASASDGGACPAGQSLCAGKGLCVPDCFAQCNGSLSCSDGGAALCVADCAVCGTQTAQCFRCGIATGFNPNGTCEDPASGSSCIQDSAYVHCPCIGYATSQCPGATQVCRPTLVPGVGACRTCGESGTSSKSCKGGGSCDTSSDTCH